MSWQVITVIIYLALNALLSIGYIGKYREPITPGMAVSVTVFSAILILLLISGTT